MTLVYLLVMQKSYMQSNSYLESVALIAHLSNALSVGLFSLSPSNKTKKSYIG